MSYLAAKAGRGLTAARDLYVTALMTIFGMRISSVLGIRTEDVGTSADGATMLYRSANKKGGFGKAKHSLKSCDAELILPGCGMPLIEIHENYLHFRDNTKSQPTAQFSLLTTDNREAPNHTSQIIHHKSPPSFFLNRSGSEVTDDYYRGFYAALGKELCLKLHPHIFRHTAGTMITKSAGIAQAASILGHSSVTTTQRYVRQSGFDQPAILSQVFSSKNNCLIKKENTEHSTGNNLESNAVQ